MMKKTKIIATIGPKSWDTEVLENMISSGMNIARINASFADHEELSRVSKKIRKLSKKIALVMDTKGHKIRLSNFQKTINLKQNELFSLFTKVTKKGVYLVTETEVELSKQIPVDSTILIDDGTIQMKVNEIKENELICKVTQGGELKKSKSVNIPGVHIEFGELSKKDYDDILKAKELEFDFVAASFIRNIRDIQAVRKLLSGSHTKLISKIEELEGVNNFDEILEESDGIMIARGDLGVEIPSEKVPILQKEFIEKCNDLGKPVIVATQMLQSMTDNITPTRAEVNDVANAIYDGADGVMLSVETSNGKHPVEAVDVMAKIALEVEKSIKTINRDPSPLAKPTTNAIAKSVIDSCQTLPIDKILVATASGTTAKTIARFRPKQTIFAFTDDDFARRHLELSKGIVPDILEGTSSTRDTGVQSLVRNAKSKNYVSDSDFVIVVAGANILGQSETNMLEINRVEHILS